MACHTEWFDVTVLQTTLVTCVVVLFSSGLRQGQLLWPCFLSGAGSAANAEWASVPGAVKASCLLQENKSFWAFLNRPRRRKYEGGSGNHTLDISSIEWMRSPLYEVKKKSSMPKTGIGDSHFVELAGAQKNLRTVLPDLALVQVVGHAMPRNDPKWLAKNPTRRGQSKTG